jgi:nicotinamidase-related amidase
MLVDRKTSALVIVDIQAKLLPTMFEAPRVVRNCQILLRLGQLLGLPTILTTQYAKGLGNTNLEILEAAGNLEPLDKTSFGCFGDARFPRLLKEHAPQANTLLLAGIESHICVAQTALGALQAGYLVHVASDATSSRTAENWQVGLRRMERAGAVVTSTEMIAYELLRASNTPEFKALLPLIK